MAALTTSECVVVYNSNAQLRNVLYTFSGVTSGDTWDASTQFSKVLTAYWEPLTGSSTGGYLTVSGNTTITVSTGNSLDAGYVFAKGSAP